MVVESSSEVVLDSRTVVVDGSSDVVVVCPRVVEVASGSSTGSWALVSSGAAKQASMTITQIRTMLPEGVSEQ